MNPRPLRPESADGGAVICSVLMYPAVLRDLRRECLLCFGADWCSLGRGVRGAVSWECPDYSLSESKEITVSYHLPLEALNQKW